MVERTTVPCGSCKVCCRGSAFPHGVVYLGDGDDASQYQLAPEGRPALARRENGDCVYLGDRGCTLWQTAPFPPKACREFDCRAYYRLLGPETRAEYVRVGYATDDLFKAIERVL